MKIRALFIAGLVLAVLALSIPSAALAGDGSDEAQARAVAHDFFESINGRKFARTCDLMSARFYRENHVPSKAQCVLGLTVGFTWAPSFRFKILGVSVDGVGAVVRTHANGVPGQLVLIRQHGAFKILSSLGS